MQGPRVVARSRVRFLTSEPVDPKTGKGTRVSFKSENGKVAKDAKGQRIRLAKSGEIIPYAAREEAPGSTGIKQAKEA